jgi:hypothetical protein
MFMKKQLVRGELAETRWGDSRIQIYENREVILLQIRSGVLVQKDVKNED